MIQFFFMHSAFAAWRFPWHTRPAYNVLKQYIEWLPEEQAELTC